MFNFIFSERDRINNTIKRDVNLLSDEEFIQKEINMFKASKKYQDMLTGERYFAGKHDILARERTVIGERGELVKVDNLPNNKIVDNQYKKMVNQKVNYILGKPFTISTDDAEYGKKLNAIFNRRFHKLLRSVGEDCLNYGIAWIFVNYDDEGKLSFTRLNPRELIPGWADREHTKLDYVIRTFKIDRYEGKDLKKIEKVEVYDSSGVHFFEKYEGKLLPCPPYQSSYINQIGEKGKEQGLNWTRLPFIAFKYTRLEQSLINSVKALQDGLNLIESNFQNSMEEDVRNTILVLVNYDGQNLGEFRRNLAQYGAVKVRTVDSAPGDLKTLKIEVNSENYKAIIEIFKKAIIENAMGYDAKNDKLGSNPNQMNILSMYSDIDLDSHALETEFQASMCELLWFVNNHLYNTEKFDCDNFNFELTFNKDIMFSESELIDNCIKSSSLLSTESILAKHPWVDDVKKELERKKTEESLATDILGDLYEQSQE